MARFQWCHGSERSSGAMLKEAVDHGLIDVVVTQPEHQNGDGVLNITMVGVHQQMAAICMAKTYNAAAAIFWESPMGVSLFLIFTFNLVFIFATILAPEL